MSENERKLKQEQNKIVAFLKENFLILFFFFVNLFVTTGMYFISDLQDGIIKNNDEKIEEYITTINKAKKEIDKVKGAKIFLFNNEKKIERYNKILDKFYELLWKDNIKIQITRKAMIISKYFIKQKPNLEKIDQFIYRLMAKKIKFQVLIYPVKDNKFLIQIR